MPRESIEHYIFDYEDHERPSELQAAQTKRNLQQLAVVLLTGPKILSHYPHTQPPPRGDAIPVPHEPFDANNLALILTPPHPAQRPHPQQPHAGPV